MKEKIQSFGRFLSGMVMPNIGAFIAWGLITALFIDTGWLPNKNLSAIVGPMLTYLLPALIGYEGGRMVGGQRGAVMGAIATMGVIVGSEYPMLMGAMVMGPLAGWVIRQFDRSIDGKIKPGFEMLVNNFSIGIIGMILAVIGYYLIGPFMSAILTVLNGGVQILVDHGVLPLISIFVEPAKVLFLNNAINHGIFTPLGAEGVKTAGRSIFYMIETNPGAGTGVLLAYWMFSKDKLTRDSAPGALIIHLLGGIHEIYFPYVLMNPLLLLATIGGSVAAMFYNSIFDLGLAGPPSPGSMFAYLGMAPKGMVLPVMFSIVVAAAVSFLIAAPIIRLTGKKENLQEATDKMHAMKAESKGQKTAEGKGQAYATSEAGDSIDLRTLGTIVFACDAGMGSSAMGAAVLKRKLENAGLSNIRVEHSSVSDIPKDAELVVCHQDLKTRAQKSNPHAKLVTITNFMNAPEYDRIVEDLVASRVNTNPEEGTLPDFHGGVLLKKNIILNLPSTTKENVIRKMGAVLKESGYVTDKYTDAMLKKETTFNTAIGNSLAIPHGIESMTGEILNSGLAIFTYPDGIDWGDGEIVKLIVGVASVGDEHIEVLQRIANICQEQEDVDRILTMNVDQIFEVFGAEKAS